MNPRTQRSPSWTRRQPGIKPNTEGTRFTMEEPKAQIGTSFLIEESLNLRFKRISDRVSATKIELNDDHFPLLLLVTHPPLERANPQHQGRILRPAEVFHLNRKTASTLFWSSVILMPRQVVHTPDSLKARVNLKRGSARAMVKIFLNTPCKTTWC